MQDPSSPDEEFFLIFPYVVCMGEFKSGRIFPPTELISLIKQCIKECKTIVLDNYHPSRALEICTILEREMDAKCLKIEEGKNYLIVASCKEYNRCGAVFYPPQI
ncbi:MAG: hypothetical protein PHI66_04200 [Candidatus Pacebacteria bacterium]|nr:hypothetical protein [Candidatus Paceibacterota bacterium]